MVGLPVQPAHVEGTVENPHDALWTVRRSGEQAPTGLGWVVAGADDPEAGVTRDQLLEGQGRVEVVLHPGAQRCLVDIEDRGVPHRLDPGPEKGQVVIHGRVVASDAHS